MTFEKSTLRSWVVQSPLWPLLRPRRFHVFGVGAPKTGTHSIARLFQYFRSGHEAHAVETIEVLKKWKNDQLLGSELRKALRRRDRTWRLECDVAHFLGPFTPYLVDLFPDAKFILTVREPRSWLRSVIDQCINNSRERLLDLTPQCRWAQLRDLYYGPPPNEYPPEEMPLKEYNLHTISGFLEHWTEHNRTVLDHVPSDRLLVVRTKNISQSLSRIASFVGVERDSLRERQRHAYEAPERHHILEDIDAHYLNRKIRRHCRPTVRRIEENLTSAQGIESGWD